MSGWTKNGRRMIDYQSMRYVQEKMSWKMALPPDESLMLNAHLPTGSRQLAISPTAD